MNVGVVRSGPDHARSFAPIPEQDQSKRMIVARRGDCLDDHGPALFGSEAAEPDQKRRRRIEAAPTEQPRSQRLVAQARGE